MGAITRVMKSGLKLGKLSATSFTLEMIPAIKYHTACSLKCIFLDLMAVK